ncbi:MAG: HD domain-containing protein, partial [Gemmatimonadota bacterium]|nr:HD domain-containing protein [Gemmatimonadota bacterium]
AIVRGHVVEGVRMARKEKVPAVLIDFISEHHGDQTIGFFLQQAVDKAEKEGREPPDPAKFRYPGPRPRTRETAILMLADSVESAARALKDPTPRRISRLIDEIFATKLERKQLNRAGLTLRDMALLKRRFRRILGGIHHRRIDYPGTRHLTARSTP